MSGLPWVATSPTPTDAVAYLKNLDTRLLDQERQYDGRSRGALSRFAVASFADLPVMPDEAAGYVVDEGYWYLRVGGAWLLYGSTRPPDPDWLQEWREQFDYADGAWNILKWPNTINPDPSVLFTVESGEGRMLGDLGTGTARSYKRIGIAPVRDKFEVRACWDMTFATASYNLFFAVRADDPPAGYTGAFEPYPALVVECATTPEIYRLNDAGVSTVLGPTQSPLIPVTTKQWIAFRVEGADIRAKSWEDGDPEPIDWDVEYVDPLPLVGDGAMWVGARFASGTSGSIWLHDVRVSQF